MYEPGTYDALTALPDEDVAPALSLEPGTRVLLHGRSRHDTIVDGHLGTVISPHPGLDGIRVHLDKPALSMMYGNPPMEHIYIVYVDRANITVVHEAETLVLAELARKILARGNLESSNFSQDDYINISGSFNKVQVTHAEHKILQDVHNAEIRKIFAAVGGQVPSKQEVTTDGR